MPASAPPQSAKAKKTLRDLAQLIRKRRKQLGISAATTAEAAGMSRMTLHRIEHGEASVTIGAFLSATQALGLELSFNAKNNVASQKRLKKIQISDYPQLKRLAWQLKLDTALSPREALNLYERNWKHIDVSALDSHERELIESLAAAFGKGRLLV